VGLHIKRSEGWNVTSYCWSQFYLYWLSAGGVGFWQAMTGYFLALGAAGMVAIYTLWFSALTKQTLRQSQ